MSHKARRRNNSPKHPFSVHLFPSDESQVEQPFEHPSYKHAKVQIHIQQKFYPFDDDDLSLTTFRNGRTRRTRYEFSKTVHDICTLANESA